MPETPRKRKPPSRKSPRLSVRGGLLGFIDVPPTTTFRGKTLFVFPGELPINKRSVRAIARKLIGLGFRIRLFGGGRLIYTRPAVSIRQTRELGLKPLISRT